MVELLKCIVVLKLHDEFCHFKKSLENKSCFLNDQDPHFLANMRLVALS
jgi:hypothetical protein